MFHIAVRCIVDIVVLVVGVERAQFVMVKGKASSRRSRVTNFIALKPHAFEIEPVPIPATPNPVNPCRYHLHHTARNRNTPPLYPNEPQLRIVFNLSFHCGASCCLLSRQSTNEGNVPTV
jgi:hypothetical protein